MAKKKFKKKFLTKTKEFVFEEDFSVGGISAEDDPLLDKCFLETKHYASIINMDDPHLALIGRSGTGKTAIIQRIKKRFQHHIEIKPETLAFQFLGSSDMVNTLREKSVALDFFYKLLWRHVFVVEILKHYFPDETNRIASMGQLLSTIIKPFRKDKERDRVISYMDQWGATLLQAPQERIKNIHDTLEKNIKARIGLSGSMTEILGANLGAEGGVASKKEIDERIKIIKDEINTIQIQDLNAAREYLSATVLDDSQKPCFVLIDDLDRFLTEDTLYYELIRALILEAYDWSKVPNIKIVYALRDNILHKVEAEFTSKSYQREKFEDHRIHLRWMKAELIDLINARLEKISADKKLTNIITLNNILPSKMAERPKGEEYILQRTFYRPRDIIDFINRAGKMSIGKKRIPWTNLTRVEYTYSKGRLDALIDEWRENSEGLNILMKLLQNGPGKFELLWWSDKDIKDVMTDTRIGKKGWCAELANNFNEISKQSQEKANEMCRKRILQIMYEVGVLGVQITEREQVKFCHRDSPILADYELEQINNPIAFVHPIFNKALGIQKI